MKQKFAAFFAIAIMGLLLSNFSFAQNNKKPSSVSDIYVISAKAGGVNFVSGDVSIKRADGKKSFLKKGDSANAGDKISTGQTGKAEILLNPGSFVRLAENSEFEFITTSLDDLAVKLSRGSAIFEVITVNELKVSVNAPKSKFYMVKSGIYRIDVMADGTAKLEVWKGKAQLENGNATILKGGQSITADDGQVAAVVKFDRDEKDEFELWSKDRAKELAKINAKLRAREMNRALITSYTQNGWGGNNSFGLWVRDPWTQSFCFLPFGFGWSSPYGFSFTRDIWSYQSTNAIVNNINQNQNMGNNQQTSNPGFERNQPGIGGGNFPSPSIPSQPMNPSPSPSIIDAPAANRPMTIMDRKAEKPDQ